MENLTVSAVLIILYIVKFDSERIRDVSIRLIRKIFIMFAPFWISHVEKSFKEQFFLEKTQKALLFCEAR